ncbi:MAG: tRNA (adenosine(37)-N6)-dimethylallyltransferase MiaA, partial [Actinomycetota bacterium]|nr:tRNA (adenosine(37)-N6)-dimethylallyltransferase MiaA [Actinomycetota bacterium]
MDARQPPVIAVVGPTGSGKSDLAVELALKLDGEVINADAMQFYRGMDIGTAKVSEAERKGIPHHLLDTLDVSEEASVSVFQQQARAAIADIHGRGKRAILAGGSGLYVRAAVDILEFPGTSASIRK